MKKKTPKSLPIICPHCEANLIEKGIGRGEKGEYTYRLWVQDKELDYEADEFYPSGEGEFFCKDCGKTLNLTEKQVIKILSLQN